MSYSTKYGPSRFDKKKTKRIKSYVPLLLGLIVFLFLFQYIMPKTSSRIRSAFFPFLEPDVRSSFYSTAKSIRAGGDPAEEIAAFCKEIIYENNR